MPTEDRCEFCDSVEAPLGVHVVMMCRNPTIETLIYPACEVCYCKVMESDSVSSFRIIKDALPPNLPIKTWTKADYNKSWGEETDGDEAE